MPILGIGRVIPFRGMARACLACGRGGKGKKETHVRFPPRISGKKGEKGVIYGDK